MSFDFGLGLLDRLGRLGLLIRVRLCSFRLRFLSRLLFLLVVLQSCVFGVELFKVGLYFVWVDDVFDRLVVLPTGWYFG